MQIYKFKFSKRFEHLSDVRFGQIEMQGAHVKPGTRVSRMSNGEGTDLTAFRHDGTRQVEDSSCCGWLMSEKEGGAGSYVNVSDLPIPCVRPVTFRLCVLNCDWKSHYDGSVQVKCFLDEVYCSELHVTDAVTVVSRNLGLDRSKSYPLERRDMRSVTILESSTVPSPSFSSKK